MTMEVHGWTDARFEVLREVAQHHLTSGDDIGFSLAAYLHGTCVVNLWGGWARRDSGQEWVRSTLAPLTSLSKLVLSILVLRLQDEGRIDLEARVRHIWPEFAQGGKDDVTSLELMSHRAGIPAFTRPITLSDELAGRPVIQQIEELVPVWKPGQAHGYHAIVLGFALCELIRRASGTAPAAALQTAMTTYGGSDLHFSLGAAEQARLASIESVDDTPPVSVDPHLRAYVNGLLDPESLLHRATFGSTAMTFDDMNSPAYHRAQRPSVYGTADAVARLLVAALVPGRSRTLLSTEARNLARTEFSTGTDLVFALTTRWGPGVMLAGGPFWEGCPSSALGHIGSTGAIAFADPPRGFTLCYLPNRRKSIFEVPDRRARALISCSYTALDRS